MPTTRIVVQDALDAALDGAVSDRAAADAPLYVLPTYTAMLALRDLLAGRGVVRSSWA